MATDNERKALLDEEARAFDDQISERIRHGHVPDLRLSTPCDYFYNNSWRRPGLAQLDFGEQFEVIRDAISDGVAKPRNMTRVLEVGCGPGYLSLELARAGFDVTGLDLSERCVAIAEMFAANDPWRSERGGLSYIVGDFTTSPRLAPNSFDVVVFLGALHHFADQTVVLGHTRDLLEPGGLVIAHEPARDRVTKGNAALTQLLRTVFSVNGNFFEHHEVITDRAALLLEISKILTALRYESNEGRKIQSINDNEAGYSDMYPCLTEHFEQVRFEWRYGFFHEIVGGLRYDEELNVRIARFLREMDRILVEAGVLSATEFLFVGRKGT